MRDSEEETEATTLAEIGALLVDQKLEPIWVELPVSLARRAVLAWQREDEGSAPLDETRDERQTRVDAGELALIGLAVDQRGEDRNGVVRVPLHAYQIGMAIGASERR